MIKNHLVSAYVVMVGAPVLGLLGILEAGRGLAAPLSVGGEWTLQFDSGVKCAGVPASLNISQSGPEAIITFNDGHVMRAVVEGGTLSGKSLQAAIAGKAGGRTLAGTLNLEGCGLLAFHAARRAGPKAGA
ncbi:MAG: hypothetical protein ABSH50_11380 [Bryobacteraceae bacterium]